MSGARGPSELELIERFRNVLGGAGSSDLVIGPGDDCAAVALDGKRLLLLTCDSLVEERHFRRAWYTPEQLGRRLAAVNLSDVAAMGGEPAWALLSLVLPDDAIEPWAEGILRGARDGLAEHGASLVGGNLSGTSGPLVADLQLAGFVARDRVLRRTGARPGDVVLVTGTLGDSAAGRMLLDRPGLVDDAVRDALVAAHIFPHPRVREGRVAAESGVASAAIDLSDGLAADLLHVCRESGVAAEIDLPALPIGPVARAAAAALGVPLEQLAVSGGEDYELLLAAPAARAEELALEITRRTGTPCAPIGRVTAAAPRIVWRDASGAEVALPPGGWDHFSGRG